MRTAPSSAARHWENRRFWKRGIYLGSHAEHPAPARGNVIEGNSISGWKMKLRCIQAAPGVKLSDNSIRDNTCTNE